MRTEEDRFHLFYQLTVATLRQISEQQKTLLLILLKRNKIVGALSEIREILQEDKKMANTPGDTLETLVLDRGGSKRVPNILNNKDKPEMTVLDQGDSKRAPNRWNNGDKLDENLINNADKDSDWPRLIPIGTHAD